MTSAPLVHSMLVATIRSYASREQVRKHLMEAWSPDALSLEAIRVYWPTLLVAAAVAAWPGGRSERNAGIVLLLWALQAHLRLFSSWWSPWPMEFLHDLPVSFFALCFVAGLLGVLCWWRRRSLRLSAWALLAPGTVLLDYSVCLVMSLPWETFR